MLLLLNVLFWLCGSIVAKTITTEDGPLILTPLIENNQADKARSVSKIDPTLFAGLDSHAAFITVNKTITREDGPLILTPLIENNQADKARSVSKVDPTLFAGLDSHAAFITVNKTITREDGPLILTPLIENNQADKARSVSKVDPTLFAGLDSHAAFITVNKTALSHLFFWFFPAPGQPLETTPWIIWLQGGPGGSSLYGLFTEIGPIEFVNGKVQRMPVTLGANYSLLFIDNPVGSGFSFTENEKYVTNEDEVGESLLNFLQQYLDVFPELRKAPLFIAGESYAGKYIPAFGHYIHNYKNASRPINLRGLAIGDGWTDPMTLLHYSQFGQQIGLLDPEQAEEVKRAEDAARKYYENGDMELYAMAAERSYQTLIEYAQVNDYNFLKDPNSKENKKKDFVQFLENNDVRKALHVANLEYDLINKDVFKMLSNDIYMSVKKWLEELIEHYGVMCYSGQLDVIVAYALSVNTYRSLQWSGAEGYKNAERQVIYANDTRKKKVNSYVKQYGNFMDVLVRGAGHMVPADQPRAAKQIYDMFIKKFAT